MLNRAAFLHILAILVFATLAGTSPSLAQHGGFRGGGGVHSGSAFHGRSGSGGFHQGGGFNTFHNGGVYRSYHGGFPGYYGGYYSYPWYGGFSFGFGFGPFWGSWGYPYGYGYYPSPYSYYPYGSYSYGGPSGYPDDRNDSSDPPDYNRDSRGTPAHNRSACDFRYENTCNTNDEPRQAAPSNVTPYFSPPDRNYVVTSVVH